MSSASWRKQAERRTSSNTSLNELTRFVLIKEYPAHEALSENNTGNTRSEKDTCSTGHYAEQNITGKHFD